MRLGVAFASRPGKPPDGLSPSGAFGVSGSFMLSQHGCRMVIVVPEIPATSQRGCVHEPWPPSNTNSMADGLRHDAIVSSAAVKPVAVWVRATGALPDVRGMRVPFAYSCRVSNVAGADHRPGVP